MRNKTWSQFANWRLVLPPSRPDAWQLDIIASQLSNKDRETPIAILGSTIEFRDLLAELGFKNIYLLEHNQQFHRLVSEDRIYSNQEKVIWGNWLESLHQTKIKFSAILSDLTSGNIEYTSRSLFYRGIARVLNSDGVFIDRILTHSIPHESLYGLAEKYRSLPINLLTLNNFSCEVLFCSELLADEEIIDSEIFYSILSSKFEHPRLQRFIHLCQFITPSGCTWWYGKPWSSLASDFELALRMIDTVDEPVCSPYANRAKLLIAERRGA